MLDFSKIRIGSEYDRKWLARHWGYAAYQAIGRGVFCPRGGGQLLLFVTKEKRKGEEQYKNDLRGDRLSWEGELKHRNDDRIERTKQSGEAIHLFYRDKHRDDFEYKGLVKLLTSVRLTKKPSEFVFEILR